MPIFNYWAVYRTDTAPGFVHASNGWDLSGVEQALTTINP